MRGGPWKTGVIVAVAVLLVLAGVRFGRPGDAGRRTGARDAVRRPARDENAKQARASPPPAPAPAAAGRAVAVSGAVFRPSGELADGATVTLRSEGARRAQDAALAVESTGDGRFVVRQVRRLADGDGEFVIRATRGGLVSAGVRVRGEELGEDPWIALRLREPASVAVRTVTPAGNPVLRAYVRLVSFPFEPIPPTRYRSAGGTVVRGRTDDEGRARLVAPPGRIRLWVRAAGKPFSAGVKFEVPAGGRWDAGDIVVPQRLARLRLRVSGPDGAPLTDAGARLQASESIQRFVDGAGDRYLHFRADENGMLVIPARLSPDPLLLAVGAEGHRVVRVACDRSRAGVFDHEIRLRRLPAFRIRLEARDGTPIPHDVSKAWRIRALDASSMRAGQTTFRTVLLGTARRPEAEDELPPEELVERLLGAEPEPQPSERDGWFTVYSGQGGRYRVQAGLPPADTFSRVAEIETSDGANPPTLRLVVDAGRPVVVQGRRVEPEEGQRRPSDREVRRIRVWAARGSWPPAAWPRGRKALRTARATGKWLFPEWDASKETRLWLRADCSELAFGYVGRLPPGIRMPDTWRVAVPADGGVVACAIPALSRRATAVPLQVVPVVAGEPVGQRGIEVRCRVPERRGVWRMRTDATGVASCLVEPGEYAVWFASGIGSKRKKRVVVRGGKPARVELDLGAATR